MKENNLHISKKILPNLALEYIGNIRAILRDVAPNGKFILATYRNLWSIYKTEPVVAEVFSVKTTVKETFSAIHPSGNSFAILTDKNKIQIHYENGKKNIFKLPKENAYEWLIYSSCGNYFFIGGICLADSQAIVILSSVEKIDILYRLEMEGYTDEITYEKISHWGEGANVIMMPSPHVGVALCARSGDSTVVLALIEVIDGKMKLFDMKEALPYHEKALAFGFCNREDTFLVYDIDSPGYSINWKDKPMVVNEWLDTNLDIILENGQTIEQFLGNLDDSYSPYNINGSLQYSGKYVVLTVEYDELINDRYKDFVKALLFYNAKNLEFKGISKIEQKINRLISSNLVGCTSQNGISLWGFNIDND